MDISMNKGRSMKVKKCELIESQNEVIIKDFIDPESLATYSPEKISSKYNIKLVDKKPGAGGMNFTWKGTKENLSKYLDAYGGPDVEELIVDGALNEDDLHPMFKKDYKNQYKKWDKEQQKIRAKRSEFDDDFELTDDKYQKDPEKWDTLKDITAGKEKDFELKKRDNIEDKNYPFYVTFYDEYPIYEPAEGGYYYAGRNAYYSKGFNSLEDAQKFAKDEMTADTSVEWKPVEIEGTVKGYKTNEKYIGEDQYITIESNNEYLGNEAGYEPYE